VSKPLTIYVPKIRARVRQGNPKGPPGDPSEGASFDAATSKGIRLFKKTIPAAIILFWLVMTSLLVRREILPKYFLDSPPRYRRVQRDPGEPFVRQMAIYMGRRLMGHTRTTFAVDRDGTRHIRNETNFDFKLSFLPSKLSLDIVLDEEGFLDRFTATISRKGTRSDLHVTLRGHAEPGRLVIDDPPGLKPLPFNNRVPLDSPFSTTLRMKDLWVGQRWRMAVINPFDRRNAVSYASAHVKGTETVALARGDIETYVVEVTFGEAEMDRMTLWIDTEGDLVKQQLPFNITLVRDEPNKKGDEPDDKN